MYGGTGCQVKGNSGGYMQRSGRLSSLSLGAAGIDEADITVPVLAVRKNVFTSTRGFVTL